MNRHQSIKARLLSISTDEVFSNDWYDMQQLPEAEALVLNFRTRHYALPGFIHKMYKLKVLVVNSKNAWLSNFEQLGLLPNLKRITLQRIWIESIIKNPIQLKSLRKISFYECAFGDSWNFEGYANLLDVFPNVEEMYIYWCESRHALENFLAEICDLVHLKKLSIIDCSILDLPEDIGNLVNLEALRLRACGAIRKLPGSITNLKELNFLDLSECRGIRELPENMGEMNLRKLDVRHCHSLYEVYKIVSNLDQLELVTSDCERCELQPVGEQILFSGEKVRIGGGTATIPYL